MTRALVLGASGFIGGWIARLLHERGDEVLGTSRAPSAPLRFDALEDDVGELLTRTRPKLIFNAIGYGVDPGERDDTLAVRINADFVERLAGRLAPGQTLIHLGSALEYGKIEGDLVEWSSPHPTTLYGMTKLQGTERLRRIAQRSGMRAMTARLFTVYGPGEHPSRLLPTLLAARSSTAALDFTAGTQRRDFTYVEDAARALLLLAASDFSPGEIVNVATGRLLSVRAFIEAAIQVLRLPPERIRLGVLPQRPEEMCHDPVSIDRMRSLISWVPASTPELGVRRTVEFRSHAGEVGH
jgi:nucleoside-diphosphate-sugar epimerase